MMVQPCMARERKKKRNRITSQAYHKMLDKNKPKKAMLQENPKKYQQLMDKAKQKAREAHKEAGSQFDLEHPRRSAEEKKQTQAELDKKSREEERDIARGSRAKKEDPKADEDGTKKEQGEEAMDEPWDVD